MSAQTKAMTREEFLAWEETQELRWEFDGVRPVAMTGGTASHAGISRNVIVALAERLRGTRCLPFGGDLKIPTPAGSYRYPDAIVTCTAMQRTSTLAPDPVVVFEVLSPSTARKDRTEKLVEYRSLPSLQRYVMLEQDAVAATVVARSIAGWSIDVLGPADTLAMPEIGIEIPMTEFYLDVELPPPEAE